MNESSMRELHSRPSTGPVPAKRLEHVDGMHRILVCLDRTEFGERILPYALALARTWGSEITLLHVLEPVRPGIVHQPADALDWQVARAEAQKYLEQEGERARHEGLTIETRLVQGYAAEQILRVIETEGVDLAVLASHGEHGFGGWDLGDTTQKIASLAPCSLLLIPASCPSPPSPAIRFSRIVLPLDGSRRAECVLPVAERIARYYRAEFLLLHVVPTPEIGMLAHAANEVAELATRLERANWTAAEAYLGELRARMSVESLEVRTLILRDADVRETLIHAPEREAADLVVLSAHGHTGSSDIPYGSHARHLVAHGSIPLLLIQDVARAERGWRGARESGRESPVPLAGLRREGRM